MLLFWFLADKKTSNEIKTDEKSAKKTAKKESTTGRSRGRPRKKETNHGNSDGNFSKLITKCNLWYSSSFTPCIDNESGRDLKRIVYVKYIKCDVLFFPAGDAVSPSSEQFFLQVRFGHSDECAFCVSKNVTRRALVKITFNFCILSLSPCSPGPCLCQLTWLTTV